MSLLEDLPVDVIREILSKLPLKALIRLAMTSRDFHHFIFEEDSLLWSCVDFYGAQTNSSRVGPSSDSLDKIDLDDIDDQVIHNLFLLHSAPSKGVRWLRLDYTRVTVKVLKWFVLDPTIAPNLKRLSLHGCQDIYLPDSHLDVIELRWRMGGKLSGPRKLSHLGLVGIRVGDQATFGGTLSGMALSLRKSERRQSLDRPIRSLSRSRPRSVLEDMPFWEESSEEEYEDDDTLVNALQLFSLGSPSSAFGSPSSQDGRPKDGLGMASCTICGSSRGCPVKRGVNRCPDCGIYQHLCTSKPLGNLSSFVQCSAVSQRCSKCGVRSVCSSCRNFRSKLSNYSSGINPDTGLCEQCTSTSGFPTTSSSRYRLMLETSFASQHGDSFVSPTFSSSFQSSSSAIWL